MAKIVKLVAGVEEEEAPAGGSAGASAKGKSWAEQLERTYASVGESYSAWAGLGQGRQAGAAMAGSTHRGATLGILPRTHPCRLHVRHSPQRWRRRRRRRWL